MKRTLSKKALDPNPLITMSETEREELRKDFEKCYEINTSISFGSGEGIEYPPSTDSIFDFFIKIIESDREKIQEKDRYKQHYDDLMIGYLEQQKEIQALTERLETTEKFSMGFIEWASAIVESNFKSGGEWYVKGNFYTTNELLNLYKKHLNP